MQIGRFRAFLDELSADPAITRVVKSVRVFRFSGGTWLDHHGKETADSGLRGDLETTRRLGHAWRPRSSPHAYFPVPTLDCVVVTGFYSPPRKATQANFGEVLGRTVQHSADAFAATHDELTGLYNRQAMEPQLKDALRKHLMSRPAAGPTVDTATPPSSVAVLTLDLDNFKQINDTYGHLYGDAVLQCFAGRIERKLEQIRERFADRATFTVARVGGEEFLALISGSVTSSEIESVAEELRQTISATALPDESEWGSLPGFGSSSVQPPHVTERKVTISIGISSTMSLRQPTNEQRAAEQLRGQADAALYRAKAGGRNVVRSFADILAKHGAVLEHHSQADIVAIDIGAQVGVSVGQEFLVYHPDFAGDRPFIFSDGRTRRKLGGYPRHPCGRIVAINVQNEISFCRVAENDLHGQFPAGAALEVVPLGAIAHLIGSESTTDRFGAPNLTPADRLTQITKQHADSEDLFAVIVFALKDVDRLAQARGSFFVNQALANLYESLREELPVHFVVSQVQSTQFAAIIANQGKEEVDALIQRVLRRAEERCGGVASFRAGAFVSLHEPEASSGEASELRPIHALDYARYAASTPEDKAEGIEWFSPETARVILSNWRGRQLYRDALADYNKLRAIGIRHALFENQAALSAMSVEPPERELALEAIRRARELSPDLPILMANHGYIEFFCGDRVKAHAIFDGIPKTYALAEVYRPPAALAAYAQWQADRTQIETSVVRDRLQEVPTNIPERLRVEIQSALMALESNTTVAEL